MDERNPSSSLKKVCCYCNNACSGAHQCRKCSKPCHAIAPCSFSADDDEGFGAKVTCCNCWLSDDDDDVVMDQNANVVRTNEATNNDQDDDAFEQFANSQITAEDNDNIDASASSSTRKRRGYTIEEKIRILDCAKTSSIHAASRRFSLDRNTIRGWKKQEAALRKMHQLAKRKRLIGGGRKLTNAQFDQELSDWVRGLRDKKLRVTRNMIFAQAQQLCINKNMKNFAASTGWLQCFMHRHNFSLRRATTVAQKEPESYTETLINFVLYVQQLIHNNYSAVYACDETAVWLDPSDGTCITEKGAKTVTVLNTGHEKARVTVILTARSDGKEASAIRASPQKKANSKHHQPLQKSAALVLVWARVDGQRTYDGIFGENFRQNIFRWFETTDLGQLPVSHKRGYEGHTATIGNTFCRCPRRHN
ncbi:hypothetical protein niasHT_012711 [Heterodera trifolii]|uniref:HTH CENPB-type domain-containing protein n=1 Tax=Heterodera trifolii TaxID=157864 RepID=A0ABD2LCW0_9BILA